MPNHKASRQRTSHDSRPQGDYSSHRDERESQNPHGGLPPSHRREDSLIPRTANSMRSSGQAFAEASQDSGSRQSENHMYQVDGPGGPPGRRPHQSRPTHFRQLSVDEDVNEPSSNLARSRGPAPAPIAILARGRGSAPIPISAPALAPVPTARVEPLQLLSQLSKDFISLTLNDFESCIRFMNTHHAVLREDIDLLQTTARSAYTTDNIDLGNRCVQRLLILRYCQKLRPYPDVPSSCRYLQDLQNDRDTYTQHHAELARVARALGAGSAQPSSREQTANHPSMGFVQHPVPFEGTNQMKNVSDTLPMHPKQAALGQNDEQAQVVDQQGRGLQNPIPNQQLHSMSHSAPVPSYMQRYEHNNTMPNVQRNHPMGISIPPPLGDRHSSQRGMNPTPPHIHSSSPDNENTVDSRSTRFTPGQGNINRRHAAGSEPRANENLRLNLEGAFTLPSDVDCDIQASDIEADEAGGYRPAGSNFFRVGRVFSLLWPLPAGQNLDGVTNPSPYIVISPQGLAIYTKEMWMLVIVNKKGYCICCPISSYGGYGLLKFGKKGKVQNQEALAHAIIYSEGQNPVRLKGEPETTKDPIEVCMSKGRPPLHRASRVHFGKFHTVEHNSAVKDIGRLDNENSEKVRNYFKALHPPK